MGGGSVHPVANGLTAGSKSPSGLSTTYTQSDAGSNSEPGASNNDQYFYNPNPNSGSNAAAWMSYRLGALRKPPSLPHLSLEQVNSDITAFRATATGYYLKMSDTGDKDLGVGTFLQSPTYQWTQKQSDPAVNQLGKQLIQDIAYNPIPAWPGWLGNPTEKDIAQLVKYVKRQ
jgi:hypothetical protein